jgi:hypothetical protein
VKILVFWDVMLLGVPDPEDKCDTVIRDIEECGLHDTN